jgi:hypothetical protein
MTEILTEVDGILESNKPKNNPTIRLGFSAVAFYELYNMEHEQAALPTGGWSPKGGIESPRSPGETIVLVAQPVIATMLSSVCRMTPLAGDFVLDEEIANYPVPLYTENC